MIASAKPSAPACPQMTGQWRLAGERADEILDAWEVEAAARGIDRNDAYRSLNEA